jgi:thiol reductant ABC exporter CydC subunit
VADTVTDQLASTRRTLRLARPAAPRLAGAAALGAGAVSASIALMGTSAWLISRAAQHPPESALALAIVGVQFFGLSRAFFRYSERLVGHDAAFRLLADLRVRVYDRLQQLAPAGLPLFRRGDLLARVVDDVDSLQDVVLRVVPPFAVAAAVGLATAAVLWALLPGAGAVLLVALAISSTVVPWLTGRLAARQAAHHAAARGELSAAVVDLVEGAPELVVMGGIEAQLARIDGADRRLRAFERDAAGTAGVGLGLTTLLIGAACWGSLTLGVSATHDGRLHGVVLAVLALVPLATVELVAPLPAAAQAMHRSRQTAGRVFAVTDAPPPVTDPEHPVALSPGPHTLRLHSVWARYPAAVEPAVRGVDLDMSPGRRIGLVGPSGAGKSTLADLMVRFLPCAAGNVRLDDVSIECFRGDDLRPVVCLVNQDPHLFNTSLAENLRVGRRSASDDELREVLDRLGLASWLASLPDGLSTEVGSFGTKLSGGQRQRVAVARALLADPSILVLDEPAEHLDSVTADALTADLLRLTRHQSTLLITHRLAGLEAADEILYMERGTVTERGRHAELLAQGGKYAGLWWEEHVSDGVAMHVDPLTP